MVQQSASQKSVRNNFFWRHFIYKSLITINKVPAVIRIHPTMDFHVNCSCKKTETAGDRPLKLQDHCQKTFVLGYGRVPQADTKGDSSLMKQRTVPLRIRALADPGTADRLQPGTSIKNVRPHKENERMSKKNNKGLAKKSLFPKWKQAYFAMVCATQSVGTKLIYLAAQAVQI